MYGMSADKTKYDRYGDIITQVRIAHEHLIWFVEKEYGNLYGVRCQQGNHKNPQRKVFNLQHGWLCHGSDSALWTSPKLAYSVQSEREISRRLQHNLDFSFSLFFADTKVSDASQLIPSQMKYERTTSNLSHFFFFSCVLQEHRVWYLWSIVRTEIVSMRLEPNCIG